MDNQMIKNYSHILLQVFQAKQCDDNLALSISWLLGRLRSIGFGDDFYIINPTDWIQDMFHIIEMYCSICLFSFNIYSLI